MRRERLVLLLLVFSMLLPQAAGAEAPGLQFDDMPGIVRPGKTERIYLTAPADMTVTLSLKGEQTAPVTLKSNVALNAGRNGILWDGVDVAGQPVAAGNYQIGRAHV